ncbi:MULTISPECIES: phosphatase PAP2 family protein [unclassified Streptomyces]|uniref:phosphatase PAP2 family protein n=1 Tax=unclassified Streptomyces TaxID=2593676 RepID=UPI003803DF47
MFGNVALPIATVNRPGPGRLARALPEAALLAAVYAGYKYGRKIANGHTDDAFPHAHSVWGLERALHLPSERLVQRAAMHWETVIHAANYFYATVHFPAMALFLGYMFLRRPTHYVWIRRAIVVQTALALVGHLLYPLAPPRMLTGSGMVDTAARYGPAVYHGTPQNHSMSNQFAAMPSLHVGWALAIAVGMIAAHRSRARWLWLLHPLITLLVVVSTANHYWLDCAVGCALLGLAILIIPSATPRPRGVALPAPGRRPRMTQPADHTSPSPLSPAPFTPAAEPDRGTRRWGQRLYVLGALVYVAGITIALLTAHPTARAAVWTVAWAALVLGAGGAGLLWIRRHKATKARAEALSEPPVEAPAEARTEPRTEVRHFD